MTTLMCFGCWSEAGAPALVREVYEFSCVGGNLHCELDDWNLEDEFFEKFNPHNPNVAPEQLAAERKCFDAFKAMSEAERYSALALEAGFFTTPRSPQ